MASKIKFNYAGIKKLMFSEGAVNLLNDCADAIANNAGNGFEVRKGGKGTRPRAYVAAVTFSAKRRQNRDHVLERSIDAGRKP